MLDDLSHSGWLSVVTSEKGDCKECHWTSRQIIAVISAAGRAFTHNQHTMQHNQHTMQYQYKILIQHELKPANSSKNPSFVDGFITTFEYK